MKEEKIKVTMQDIQRYKVLQNVIAKKLKGYQAAQILNLSYVHISRLKRKVLQEGFLGLLRKIPPAPPHKKITPTMLQEILQLCKNLYYDFNIMHFKDKLREIHKIYLGYESLRQILIKTGEHYPKKKRILHRQRRRMPKAGMLVQMDSSQHHWIETISEKWWLIAMIDDATHGAESAYMPLPSEKNLDLIFCIKKQREVRGDNTITVNGQIIQIPPSTIRLSFTKARVDVCLLEDKRILVVYRGEVIAESMLFCDNKRERKAKQIEELLNKREYFLPEQNRPKRKPTIPSPDHPWRKYFATWFKSGQFRKI